MVSNFFSKFMKPIFPKLAAAENCNDDKCDDGELVDPHEELMEKCRQQSKIKNLVDRYDECAERVSSKTKTTETCIEELMDMMHAIDECVTPLLWPRLK